MKYVVYQDAFGSPSDGAHFDAGVGIVEVTKESDGWAEEWNTFCDPTGIVDIRDFEELELYDGDPDVCNTKAEAYERAIEVTFTDLISTISERK